MQVEKLRSLIRESIQEYIKEIDIAAEGAAMEARITKCEEAITSRETKLENLRNLEEAAGMLDENKVKAMENEIKELKKAKLKFERLAEKRAAKLAGKDKKKVTTDAKTEEAPIDEADVTAQMEMSNDEMKEGQLYLGHDHPQYRVELSWLLERKDKLWVHTKDFESLDFLIETGLRIFFHEQERQTIINNTNLIWSHDLESANSKSIIPLLDLQSINEYGYIAQDVYGVCSDYLHEVETLL